MSKLEWNKVGERNYETGIEEPVLYPQVAGLYPKGVAWNGLISVTEKPSGAEATPFYASDITYLNLLSNEKYAAGIEAFTYPDEFEECDGSKEVAPGVSAGQQTRKPFGMAYKTLKGNDTDGTDLGYVIHLMYGALASPTEKAHNTINETPDARIMNWEVSTTPVKVPGCKPSATLDIDSTKVNAAQLASLEKILFGTNADASAEPAVTATEPRLPLPEEVATIFKEIKD